MTFQLVHEKVIPATMAMLPSNMDSPAARVALLAIGGQESRFASRRQLIMSINSEGHKVLLPLGPAKGFWQFEKGGAVKGLLNYHNATTRERVHRFVEACGVKPVEEAVWSALEHDDVLACGLARLLLWTDPRALPAVGEKAKLWDVYISQWRPGKPHPESWDDCYKKAVKAVTA
ncbi:hypothetical protein [Pseudomonas phage vB_Pae-PA152]|nr:hypothetical protein [Pseudomonas phage vB_Pae-PA152]